MNQDHASHDDIHFLDPQTIHLSNFDATGYILDIGGGGEGVIGQLKGDQVVAIDRRKAELEEAPPGGLKIVMEATDLQFLDDTFGTATAFFTLMYIRERADCARIFAEVYRVLEPGGRFLIWDAVIPAQPDTGKAIVAFPLTIHLPQQTIETGYGSKWPAEEKNLDTYRALAEQAGFTIVHHEEKGRLFEIVLRKPGAASYRPISQTARSKVK